MKTKNGIIISVITLFVITLLLLGLTYAYYRTRIIGNNSNEPSISVQGEKMEITYSDKTAELNMEGPIEPDFIYTKEFTIENTGDGLVHYAVYLEDVINEFKRYEDIELTLTCVSSLGNDCSGLESGAFPRIDSILVTNAIEKSEKQNYELKVQYLNKDVDQSEDMGKKLEARISIYDVNDIFANTSSLSYKIINNAKTAVGSTVYRNTPLTLPGQEGTTRQQETIGSEKTFVPSGDLYYVYAASYEFDEYSGYTLVNPQIDKYSDIISNPVKLAKFKYARDYNGSNAIGERTINIKDTNKIISATENEIVYQELALTPQEGSVEKTLSTALDDYGVSYYFRGDVEDNYINYNNMCWRIVRVQGDGSIKIILEDFSSECNPEMSLSNRLGQAYYGSRVENGIYNADYLNAPKETAAGQRTLRSVLNSWLTDGTVEYEHDVFNTSELKKGDWCLGNTNDAYNLEYPYNILENTTASSLKSTASSFIYDSYQRIYREYPEYTTLKCGNGLRATDDYIGALTADEIINAGEKFGFKTLSGNYLKSDPKKQFFGLTVMDFGKSKDNVYVVRQDYSTKRAVTDLSWVRPVIVLKNVNVLGDGSINNPYIINK